MTWPSPQLQPHPNRQVIFAPEGAKPPSPPPFIPANDNTDEMEIVFVDDPEATDNGEANHQPEHHDLFGLPDPEQYG